MTGSTPPRRRAEPRSGYDNADAVTSTTDARGTKLLYTYDALGQKTAVYEMVLSGLGRARWTYDTIAKGQLTQFTRYVGSAGYIKRLTAPPTVISRPAGPSPFSAPKPG